MALINNIKLVLSFYFLSTCLFRHITKTLRHIIEEVVNVTI